MSAPVTVSPAICTVLPFATVVSANEPEAVETTSNTSSLVILPTNWAFVVVISAEVVPSNILVPAVIPVTVSSLRVTDAVALGWVSV